MSANTMKFLPKKTIVVPVDFAEESVNAVSTALECVDDPADVHVVHVMVPPQNMSPAVLWSEVINEPREEKAQSYMHSFLKEHNFTGVTTAFEEGDAGLEICDYAKKSRAEMMTSPNPSPFTSPAGATDQPK